MSARRKWLSCAVLVSLVIPLSQAQAADSGYVIEHFPILEALQAQGVALAPQTLHWMKKWQGLNLEDPSLSFPDLGGATSITMKIRKADPTDPQNSKSLGAFVPRNGAGNPNTGIAYFNMSAIVGYDAIFRPGVRYEAGPRAVQALHALILSTPTKGRDRLQNRDRILQNIAKGGRLNGYIKTGKPDGISIDAIGNPGASPNGAPKMNHPIIAFLQANNPKPKTGTPITLANGYSGDQLELAREYSVIMTLDAVFQQWDRYSGANTLLTKDDAGQAHFYAVDSDGSDIAVSPSWTVRNLSWFSRYDGKTINRLKEVYAFLNNPASGFLGYTDAEKFIVDLGLYFENPPAVYVSRIKRNLGLLLERVNSIEAKYGDAAYL
jgi:hypothetical protein